MKGKEKDEIVFDSIFKMLTKYAESSPYCLNPDKTVVKNIVQGLTRNKLKYGYAFCPCRSIEDIPKKHKNYICPCRWHKEEIARQGSCECGLFVSKLHRT